MQTHTAIDPSLARFVRRAYFKHLHQEWAKTDLRIKKGKLRNQNFGKRIDTEKQLRECAQNYEKAMGSTLPISSIRLDANSRSANVILCLSPDPVPQAVNVSSNAEVRVILLLRQTGVVTKSPGIVVSGHAVDRVIQRCKLIELPINRGDLEAINAEFADALPLACLACSVLSERQDPEGISAHNNILLPSAHGVFLASWLPEERRLLVKTFVDGRQLVQPQIEAVREIAAIGEGQINAHILDAMAPGWLQLRRQDINRSLFDAWQHFGWRFDIERLHPGLSDDAWQLH